ncbi:molybdenum cofactor biosynthesis protein MoaE [uncultured Maritalea sp.]|uniref:molybdenum cofactor biosynthesis protein MoaE n=1 Tax=uncultured Maritalea sp. TaxID=757249 RepID=UPI00262BF0F0|nr:molybdenum cofactor biosynthesis protein MoaE [uncultured Maritalea sp.]
MNKVEIIIPKQNNSGESLAAVTDGVKANFCNVFGGYTAIDAEGGWVSNDGTLFKEPVTIIFSAATKDKSADADLLIAIAKDVLAITDQLAVFVSIDGQAEIIE